VRPAEPIRLIQQLKGRARVATSQGLAGFDKQAFLLCRVGHDDLRRYSDTKMTLSSCA